MKNIIPDYRLDVVGEPCPYLAVVTLEVMPSLQKGEILEAVSDCPRSINNIPLDARNHGYMVLDIRQDGPTIRYLIQKQSRLMTPPATNIADVNLAPPRLTPPSTCLEDPLRIFTIACNT